MPDDAGISAVNEHKNRRYSKYYGVFGFWADATWRNNIKLMNDPIRNDECEEAQHYINQ